MILSNIRNLRIIGTEKDNLFYNTNKNEFDLIRANIEKLAYYMFDIAYKDTNLLSKIIPLRIGNNKFLTFYYNKSCNNNPYILIQDLKSKEIYYEINIKDLLIFKNDNMIDVFKMQINSIFSKDLNYGNQEKLYEISKK